MSFQKLWEIIIIAYIWKKLIWIRPTQITIIIIIIMNLKKIVKNSKKLNEYKDKIGKFLFRSDHIPNIVPS